TRSPLRDGRAALPGCDPDPARWDAARLVPRRGVVVLRNRDSTRLTLPFSARFESSEPFFERDACRAQPRVRRVQRNLENLRNFGNGHLLDFREHEDLALGWIQCL